MKNSFYISFIIAILYYVTGVISFKLLDGNHIVSMGIFAPEGIALAFALYYGKRVVGGIFIGQLFLAYTNHIETIPAFEIAIINTCEAVFAIYLFNKFKLSKELKTFRDILGLLVLIVFILQPFSAIFSNLALFVHNQSLPNGVVYSTFSWWFGNVMGQLLFTPFLLLFFTHYESDKLKEYIFYGVIYGCYLFFLEIILEISNPFMLMSLSLFVLILVIAKKGIIHGSYLSVVASILDSIFIYCGIGVFSRGNLIDNTIDFNLYILSHIVIVWMFGILLEERKNYEKHLKEKIAQEVQKNKEQQLMMLQQNRLAQMGELISMIAHQWRQPLNNISLVNQILITKYDMHKLDDEAIEYFKIHSKKQIELMSNTIDDFRNFFKNEDEKYNFVVNEVIKGAIDMVEPIFKKHNIKIEFLKQENMMSYGYTNALAQVLLNVLNNANDILSQSKVEQKIVTIRLENVGHNVVVLVEDNGGGIDEKIIDKIFDPYFSTKKDKNGTGLGLYMSKMIMEEQMQGNINVKNTDKGAMFMIVLKGMKI